ncbi:MAG: thermosome subunit beta [Thermoplasmatales archaeon]|jgi:thermosome|nr:TCP-1/cpn60 chaperonin family protein [Candidatus Thermoplasmatota archaeon]MDA8054401.1 thermosome subunit beta [Thermoplasmatales archaeon]
MMPGQPIFILKEGAKRETGKNAMQNNINAAKSIADAVKTTLGPRGMDKMLVDSLGDIVITNDGVTILKEMDIDHPAAKMMVEVSKTQDQEVGDGTTTAAILAGEFLRKAEDLLDQNVHPTVIASGYRMAAEKAKEVLNEISTPVGKEEKVLLKIATTALNSKGASTSRKKLADIAVKSVMQVAQERGDKTIVDFDDIQLVKKQGGSVDDTQLIQGVIVDKERVHPGMPVLVNKARIALLNAALEIKKPEFDTSIRIEDPESIMKFKKQEESILKNMVEKIKVTGANVILTQKGIDDLAMAYLAKDGIYAARRVKKSDIEKLAKAIGGEIITNMDDLTAKDLGNAERVEEVKIGEDHLTFVTGCKNPKAVSVLVRGGTEHVVDEVERSLVDSLHVVAAALQDGKIIPGGGAAAIEIAMKLREYSASVGGREQLAIEKFAEAIEIIPRTLSENAGLDSIGILISLKKEHADGKKNAGVDVVKGKPIDMIELGVIEPIRVGKQAIDSATDAAVMILRIDDVIATKATSAGAPRPPGGRPGGEED